MGTQRVRLSAGTVEYQDSGGTGRAVVLCHGLLMDGSVWDTVMPHLDGDLRVIRPVLPVGRAPDPDARRTQTCRCVAKPDCSPSSSSSST